MKAKYLTLIAAGLLSAFPVIVARAAESELHDVIIEPQLRTESVYTRVIDDVFNPKETSENQNLGTSERLLNFFVLYRGSDSQKDQPPEKYASQPILERFSKNLEYNLKKDIAYISSFEAKESWNNQEFLYTPQVWNALVETIVERYDFARSLDDFFERVHDVTTVSVKKGDTKLTLAPFVESDAVGIYLNLNKGKTNFSLIGDNKRGKIEIQRRLFNHRNFLFYTFRNIGFNSNKEEDSFSFGLKGLF